MVNILVCFCMICIILIELRALKYTLEKRDRSTFVMLEISSLLLHLIFILFFISTGFIIPAMLAILAFVIVFVKLVVNLLHPRFETLYQ